MAKKVAVPDEESPEKNNVKPKKERNKCCTCCLIFVIVLLVIFAVVIGVGWYLGDSYTQKYFGMSLGDTFGVVGDLYGTKDKDVVKNPYSKNDLDDFYKEIKRNILLRDDAPADFDGALQKALDEYFRSGSAGVQALNARDGENDGENDSETGGDNGNETGGEKSESGNAIIDVFINMIADVMKREYIDVERLNKFPQTDEYIFNLKDKQLAAFINSALVSALKNADKIDGLSALGDYNIDLSKSVALKQVRFTGRAGEGGEITASSAQVTVWIGLQDAAGSAIKVAAKQAGVSWAAGMMSFLGDVLLPKNLYITVSLPLLGDDKPDVIINDMNASEQARAKKLINGVLRLSGNSADVDEIIGDYADTIKPLLQTATDKMDFSAAGNGTLSVDLLSIATDMISSGEQSKKLTKADFIYVMQALFSERDKQLRALTPYRYDNRYLVDGKEVYLDKAPEGAVKIDYERRFIEQIESKYALKFADGARIDDVLESFGVSLSGESSGISASDIINKVDADAFDALLHTDRSRLTLDVTDRMLAAAFAGQMGNILSSTAGMENIDLTLEALTFISKPDRAGHTYAMLAVEADISALLGDLGGAGSMVNKLVGGLLPEGMLLTVTIDITDSLAANDSHDAAEFIVNSCDNTDRALDAIEKLVPDLKISEISDQISNKLNEVLEQMRKQLSVRLVPSTVEYDEDLGDWVGEQGKLALPDIFKIVSDLVFTDEDGNVAVTPDEIQAVVRDLNSPVDIESNISVDDDGNPTYGRFISDVMSKYYFTQPDTPISTFAGLTDYMSDFAMSKLNIYDENGLAYDTRTIDELRPVMTGGELGALFAESMGGNAAIDDYSIVRVDTGKNTLSVTLGVALDGLLENAGEVNGLIKTDTLYATATFDLGKVIRDGEKRRYDVRFKIGTSTNDTGYMTDETFDAMLKMVRFFAPEFDIQAQIDEFGAILYEQMRDLNNSLDISGAAGDILGEDFDDGGASEQGKKSFFHFTVDGLEIDDFYTFLVRKMRPGMLDRYTADKIKDTLQGMYLRSDDPDKQNPNNYDVADVIFNTPLSTEPWDNSRAQTMFAQMLLDSDFNGFLKRGVEGIDTASHSVKIEQTAVLAKGDRSAAAVKARAWLNRRFLPEDVTTDIITDANDYLVVTFSMSMEGYLGGDGGADEGNELLFPTKIYATIVYKYVNKKFVLVPDPETDPQTNAVMPVVIFNNMSSEQYAIVTELLGVSPDSSDKDKDNIASVAKKSTDVLNALSESEVGGIKVGTTITFYGANPAETRNGIGYIQITPNPVTSPAA